METVERVLLITAGMAVASTIGLGVQSISLWIGSLVLFVMAFIWLLFTPTEKKATT
jgi:hypothetical protein